MRVARFAATAVLCAAPVFAADYDWPVVRVVDGDTVAVDASGDMPPELAALRVRLRGMDAPGSSREARCEAERLAGQAATTFVTERLASAGRVVIRDPAWGRWGGRVIADVLIDGENLAAALVAAGHGRPYDGGKRGSWCEQTHRRDDD